MDTNPSTNWVPRTRRLLVALQPTTYYPGKNIAIDEGLVPWKGNIHFKTFNAKKNQ